MGARRHAASGVPRARHAVAAVAAVLASWGWTVWAAASNATWYARLHKPTFAMPLWLAALVSAILAAALALGLYRVLCGPDYLPDRKGALRLCAILLVASAGWAWIFFSGRHPTLGLCAAALLAVAALMSTWRLAKLDRVAALLVSPTCAAALYALLFQLSLVTRGG